MHWIWNFYLRDRIELVFQCETYLHWEFFNLIQCNLFMFAAFHNQFLHCILNFLYQSIKPILLLLECARHGCQRITCKKRKEDSFRKWGSGLVVIRKWYKINSFFNLNWVLHAHIIFQFNFITFGAINRRYKGSIICKKY